MHTRSDFCRPQQSTRREWRLLLLRVTLGRLYARLCARRFALLFAPRFTLLLSFLVALSIASLSTAAAQDIKTALTSELSLSDAFQIARNARAELRVAAARLDAAHQGPIIAASLNDPIISPSIDHKPVDPMMRTDRSITIEQSFPLSHIRSHRRRAAEADVDKVQAEQRKLWLKIEVEVAQAYFMLNERRKLHAILLQQQELARQLTKLVAVRYGTGTATQSEVLRLEVEEARLRGRLALMSAELHSAEAMLNTALGRDPQSPLPSLQIPAILEHMSRSIEPAHAMQDALRQRAELRIAEAEKRRANAEIDVMKSMYAPMAMVKVGVANTMNAGRGYMLMVGVTVPIWFDRMKAGVREASAMARMAEADQEAMQRMIQGDVAAALEAMRGAREHYQILRSDLVPRVERTLHPAMAEYTSGKSPLTAVLEANKSLWMVQEELTMAETSLGLSWIRLRSALGHFGESP